MKYIFFLVSFFCVFSCSEEVVPKPYGHVRLEYPRPKYIKQQTPSGFNLERSTLTTFKEKEKAGWYNINYPKLKATIYLTHYS